MDLDPPMANLSTIEKHFVNKPEHWPKHEVGAQLTKDAGELHREVDVAAKKPKPHTDLSHLASFWSNAVGSIRHSGCPSPLFHHTVLLCPGLYNSKWSMDLDGDGPT